MSTESTPPAPPAAPEPAVTKTDVTSGEILMYTVLGVLMFIALVVWFILSVIRYLKCSHDDPKRFQWVKDIKGQAIALFLSAFIIASILFAARLMSFL